MDLPKYESPGISINTTEGELILHWFNSRLRVFEDEQFDHVEYRDDDDQLRGIKLARAIMDLMFENNYPMQYDPVVDPHTMNWFIETELKDLDKELDDI